MVKNKAIGSLISPELSITLLVCGVPHSSPLSLSHTVSVFACGHIIYLSFVGKFIQTHFFQITNIGFIVGRHQSVFMYREKTVEINNMTIAYHSKTFKLLPI